MPFWLIPAALGGLGGLFIGAQADDALEGGKKDVNTLLIILVIIGLWYLSNKKKG